MLTDGAVLAVVIAIVVRVVKRTLGSRFMTTV